MNNIKRIVFTIWMFIGGGITIGQTFNGTLPLPAFQWRCIAGNATLNNNPALQLTSGAMIFDSIPYAKDYTMIVVYKPVAGEETSLWQMTFGDNITRGLTTERILSDSISIRYAERTDVSPAINTLRQSSPDSTTPYARLTIEGNEALKIAEIVYFAERLDNATLRTIQSQLAVRYGITLGPVAYLDGVGHPIWDYVNSGLYHHRVTGVGNDTLTGLYQIHSRSEMNGAMLTIATDSLEYGSFLMVGDNDAPLAFEQDGNIEILRRNWKIQSTQIERKTFSLTFDTRKWAKPGDSLVLLVDNYIYLPDNVIGDSVVFSGVEFQTDSTLFSLGRGSDFWRLAQSKEKGNGVDAKTERDGKNVQSHFATRIYPNPTSGHYDLDVEGANQVQVTIYNVHGNVMATYTSEGGDVHHFEGNLPSGNVYYATISTENGSQTLKLVVIN